MCSDSELQQLRDASSAIAERARADLRELAEAPGHHALAEKRKLVEVREQAHAHALAQKRELMEGLAAGDRAIRQRVQAGRFVSRGRQGRWARRRPQRVARPKRRRASRVHSARSPARPPDDPPVAGDLLAGASTPAIPPVVPDGRAR